MRVVTEHSEGKLDAVGTAISGYDFPSLADEKHPEVWVFTVCLSERECNVLCGLQPNEGTRILGINWTKTYERKTAQRRRKRVSATARCITPLILFTVFTGNVPSQLSVLRKFNFTPSSSLWSNNPQQSMCVKKSGPSQSGTVGVQAKDCGEKYCGSPCALKARQQSSEDIISILQFEGWSRYFSAFFKFRLSVSSLESLLMHESWRSTSMSDLPDVLQPPAYVVDGSDIVLVNVSLSCSRTSNRSRTIARILWYIVSRFTVHSRFVFQLEWSYRFLTIF